MSLLTFSISNFSVSKSLGILDTEGIKIIIIIIICQTYSYDLGHLARFDRSISVNVVHLERPLELLFRFSGGSDVNGEQELLEVDASAVVGVERPEHVLAELLRVALWEETRVDFEKLGPRQLARRTIFLQFTAPTRIHRETN